jgi:O-acetylhomoserine/O-acetylserine sulfhydrylase-like pyridoxal-dependent enzyme
MKKRTRVAHPPEVAVPPGNRPLIAPIYQSVKFTFDDVEETRKLWRGGRDGYWYSRLTNPTLRQLGFLDRIHVEWRFGSSTGYDYEFYAVPQR